MRLPRRPAAIVAAAWVGFAVVPRSGEAQVFRKHVAVCQQGDAADVGRKILDKGGNAVDAAIATAFALAVTLPAAGNIGGGGFLTAYVAETKEVVVVEFREKAPAAAHAKMYLDEQGKLLARHREGPRAAGVPGTVRGLGLAHRRYGRLPWADLVRPAVLLAEDGFAISRSLASSLNAQLGIRRAESGPPPEDLGDRPERLSDFPESISAYGKPDRSAWKEGDRLFQLDLARTLDRIARLGPDEFYTGETARLIASHNKKYGGLITLEDLADYQPNLRAPVSTTYRGHRVFSASPPSAGGASLMLMLNILERFDLKSDGRDHPRTVHRVTEAMRRAFYQRAESIGDPDFSKIPIAKLVSKEFAAEVSASIGERATPSRELAKFPVVVSEGANTTHLSTLDSSGNAVALTYTLEEGYGCKSVVGGAGFLLNNEMGDFNLIPGRTDETGRVGTPPNLIAPGKRMLSSQTPTIVLKDDKVRLITGSPGGRTIPNTTLWVVLDVLEFGMSPRDAVDAPRSHHQWFPDVLNLEGSKWSAETLAGLRERGHRLKIGGTQGDAHSIIVEPGTGRIHGAADRRRTTSKASGD